MDGQRRKPSQRIIDMQARLLDEIDRGQGIAPVNPHGHRSGTAQRRYAAQLLEQEGAIRIIRRRGGGHRLYMARAAQADEWEGKLRAWEEAGGTGEPSCFPQPSGTAPVPDDDDGLVTLAQAMADILARPAPPRPRHPPEAPRRTGRNAWTPRPPVSVDDSLVGQNLSRLLSGHTEWSIVQAMRARGFSWTTWTLRNTEQGSRQLRLTEAVAICHCIGVDPADGLFWLLNSVEGLAD